ncbi:DUF2306 domain-containing protein [uncultured Microbacterium sp.]|uniref:DUF2306 domain-containing protein n=1 Tax=uncultured Microbacterium sp. TaxID=191216 RepID=UPI0028D1D313|nr:DUF2306 domain-containing protein [uncultured Microbacterium sp.]
MTLTIARPRSSRREWLIPASLLVLTAIPVLAGALRLTSLASGADVTPDNARFFALPLPVILHIVGATVYCGLGAFQFVPSLRQRHPRYHGLAGRVLVPAGLVAAASGLWMTTVYDLPAADGGKLPLIRWVFGLVMIAALVLGFAAVLRRDFATHRAWMMRAYAIGLGAGTQVLTTVPWMIATGGLDTTSKTIAMTAGWVINLAVAEIIIRRSPAPGGARRGSAPARMMHP